MGVKLNKDWVTDYFLFFKRIAVNRIASFCAWGSYAIDRKTKVSEIVCHKLKAEETLNKHATT